MSNVITAQTKFSHSQEEFIIFKLEEFIHEETLHSAEFMFAMGEIINRFAIADGIYHPVKEKKSAEEKKKIREIKEEFINTVDDESAEGWVLCDNSGRGTSYVADKVMETPLNPYPYYLDWKTAVKKAEETGAGGIQKTIKGYSLRVGRISIRQKTDSEARRNDGIACWVREYRFSDSCVEGVEKFAEKYDRVIKPYNLLNRNAINKPTAKKMEAQNREWVQGYCDEYLKYLEAQDFSEEFEFICPLGVGEWKRGTKKSKKTKKIKSQAIIEAEEDLEDFKCLEMGLAEADDEEAESGEEFTAETYEECLAMADEFTAESQAESVKKALAMTKEELEESINKPKKKKTGKMNFKIKKKE